MRMPVWHNSRLHWKIRRKWWFSGSWATQTLSGQVYRKMYLPGRRLWSKNEYRSLGMTDKSDDRVGHLNTILAQGGRNLSDPMFKSSNAQALLRRWGGGGGMLKIRVDRRIISKQWGHLAPVVQTMNITICQINRYPLDNSIGLICWWFIQWIALSIGDSWWLLTTTEAASQTRIIMHHIDQGFLPNSGNG